MSDDAKLQEACDTLILHSAHINQELARLRALLERAEWSAAGRRLESTCPWCGSRSHEGCPVFESRGILRGPTWHLKIVDPGVDDSN